MTMFPTVTILALIPIVWPSKFSKLDDFLELAREATFYPSSHTVVRVNVQQLPHASIMGFSAKPCDACNRKLHDSRVLDKVARVNWEMLHTST